MKAEALAVDLHTLLFFAQRVGFHLRGGGDSFGEGAHTGDQFPSAFAQQQALDRSRLAGGGEQPPLDVA